MKTLCCYFFLLTLSMRVAGQGLQIKNGDQFPNIPIQNLLNAPTKSFELVKKGENKFYILNFWGTWCSPCIPEMDHLAQLQNKNSSKMQVIAIADDEPNRLHNFLKKKPSKLWLASDTSGMLYQLFGFSSVGQSAIVNAKGKVIALVKTDSINQTMIDQIAKGITVKSSAQLKEKPVNHQEDIFAVDSTLSESFTLRSYMIGQQSMSKRYSLNSVYNNRRITFINSTVESIYRSAYHIISPKQVAYEIPEKEVADYNNKHTLYCLDLLIAQNEKDRLFKALQQKLHQLMPVKARIEFREMPIYALVSKGFHQEESKKTALSYSFSGKGYESEGASLEEFADDYLSNEFELPVVDETGLTKRYDIKTNVALRDKSGILKSINDLGLDLVKKTKVMKVLIFYK